MPWYWTDDLARSLIAAGKVEQSAVTSWLVTPVAIRSGEDSPDSVVAALMEDEYEPPSPALSLAA